LAFKFFLCFLVVVDVAPTCDALPRSGAGSN